MTHIIKLGAFGDLSAGPPTEFQLLKPGRNAYIGDELLFDDQAAAEVMKRYRARGLDLMADYEHQSLASPPVIAPAAAKRWVPEVRGGSLLATQIAWTEQARRMLMAGEYRYFSIACRFTPSTKRVTEVVNFALTNLPAADNIAPLMAASASRRPAHAALTSPELMLRFAAGQVAGGEFRAELRLRGYLGDDAPMYTPRDLARLDSTSLFMLLSKLPTEEIIAEYERRRAAVRG